MADSETIEAFDRKRRQYYRGYVVGVAVSAMACVVRLVITIFGPLSPWLSNLLFTGLMISIAVQLYFFARLSRIKAQASQDPELKAVIADELTQFHQMKAWKYAFLSTVACLLAILFISAFFAPIHEITTVVTLTLLVGAGAYHVCFWYMERE
jgi:hypothetical protein